MNTKKQNLTTKLVVIVSAILLITNLLLGALVVHDSREVVRTLISNRMLDISNTAADMLDGDVLEKLTVEDQGTPPYQKISDTLAFFQKNIDIRYIYCIRAAGEKEFVFGVDPTVKDPGTFGEPIVYTEALYKASKGNAAVDEESYTDRWGSFYSAYSPVFNSEGKVAGIVAVDFDAKWYDNWITRQTKSIFLNSIVAIFIAVVFIIIITSKLRREIRTVSEDLNEIARDVNEITHEIMPDTRTPHRENSDDFQDLSLKVHMVKQSLKQYTSSLKEQTETLLESMFHDCCRIYYVNMDSNSGICFMGQNDDNCILKKGDHFPYQEAITRYAHNFVTEEYRDGFLYFTDPENVQKNLIGEKTITYRYQIRRNNRESFERIRFMNIDNPKFDVHTIGVGFIDESLENTGSSDNS